MATSVCNCFIFMIFLYLAFLLSLTNGLQVVTRYTDANCATQSGSFRGPCFFKEYCEGHCKDKEGADGGDCSGFKCYCEKNCGKLCEWGSGTWKGLCIAYGICDRQCRKQENAVLGYCDGALQCRCARYC